MKPTTLRDRGLIPAPFDTAVPALRAAWRRVLVETLGGIDDGTAVHVVGSPDRRHVYTLSISPGDDVADPGSLCLPLTFELTTKERLIAEGHGSLWFLPSIGARRATMGELIGTIRWTTSRLGRYRSLGHGCISIQDAVGTYYQKYLTALGRASINHR